MKIVTMSKFVLPIVLLFLFNLKKEINCAYTEEPIIIDGNLKEWINVNYIYLQNEKESGAKAYVKTLWDDEYLYISYEVKDTNLSAVQTTKDHPELYLDDMVEFLFDTRNEKKSCWNDNDLIYHINLLGQKKDDKGSINCTTNPDWDGHAEYKIKVFGTLNDCSNADKGYVAEIKISFEELQLCPHEGLKIGANFAIGDNGKLFDWVGASPFRSPEVFGEIILKK